MMRGKPWSVIEERHLRQLLEEGRSLDEISRIMDKIRVFVKSKLCNLCLSVVVATGQKCAVATATAAATSTRGRFELIT